MIVLFGITMSDDRTHFAVQRAGSSLDQLGNGRRLQPYTTSQGDLAPPSRCNLASRKSMGRPEASFHPPSRLLGILQGGLVTFAWTPCSMNTDISTFPFMNLRCSDGASRLVNRRNACKRASPPPGQHELAHPTAPKVTKQRVIAICDRVWWHLP